jgi:ATP-dependent Clp protease ATP-binding subunit ClpA
MGVEFLRFDMSEYMERHTVSRLIGAPPAMSASTRAAF